MVKRSKGIRSDTRQVFKKRARDRGLTPITRRFQKFEDGEKAHITIDPGIHKGQPHSRFQGLTGTIIGSRGGAYLLRVRTGNKLRTVISRPEHLRKAKPGNPEKQTEKQ
jgi:large subunit ribosomal protein L21e